MPDTVDILDRSGRLRRFIISLTTASIATVIAVIAAFKLVGPTDTVVVTSFGGSRSFVGMVLIVTFVLVYVTTLWSLKRLDARRDAPRARALSRGSGASSSRPAAE